MDLHIKTDPGQMVRLFVDGQLQAEIFPNATQVRDDLVEELKRARQLRALPKIQKAYAERLDKVHLREDPVGKPQKKTILYLAGFADGLLDRSQPHPMLPDTHTMPLHGSPCYGEGFETGRVIHSLQRQLDAAPPIR